MISRLLEIAAHSAHDVFSKYTYLIVMSLLATCPPVYCPVVYMSSSVHFYPSTVYTSTCLSVLLSTCPLVFTFSSVYFHLPNVHLSVCLPVHLTTRQPVDLPTYIRVFQFLFLSVYLSTCLFVHLSSCLPLPVHMSTCPFFSCGRLSLSTVYSLTWLVFYLFTCLLLHVFVCTKFRLSTCLRISV